MSAAPSFPKFYPKGLPASVRLEVVVFESALPLRKPPFIPCFECGGSGIRPKPYRAFFRCFQAAAFLAVVAFMGFALGFVLGGRL